MRTGRLSSSIRSARARHRDREQPGSRWDHSGRPRSGCCCWSGRWYLSTERYATREQPKPHNLKHCELGFQHQFELSKPAIFGLGRAFAGSRAGTHRPALTHAHRYSPRGVTPISAKLGCPLSISIAILTWTLLPSTEVTPGPTCNISIVLESGTWLNSKTASPVRRARVEAVTTSRFAPALTASASVDDATQTSPLDCRFPAR